RGENTPLALLINKWDRRTPRQDYKPEKARSELDAFLGANSPPRHRGLEAALRNSVLPGHYEHFAVSAFGEHEVVAVHCRPRERPKLTHGQLGSFGLEDAFIWAARKRNEIDLEDFQKRASIVKRWLWPWGLLREGRALAARFQQRSKEHQTVKKLWAAC